MPNAEISVTKANQLASCAVVNSDRGEIRAEWDEIDFLLQLLPFGMDPNKGPKESIWVVVLQALYDLFLIPENGLLEPELVGPFSESSGITEKSPIGKDISRIIEIFYRAGADPYAIVTLDIDFPHDSAGDCFAVRLQIVMDEVPIVLDKPINAVELGESGAYQKRKQGEGRAGILRVWFLNDVAQDTNSNSESSSMTWWPAHGHVMSSAESDAVHKWLRLMLDISKATA